MRLRKHAAALPGSPFALVVKPGAAHHMSTSVSATDEGLRGVVGKGPTDGCTLVMQAADQMGNLCIKGGEKVECKVEKDSHNEDKVSRVTKEVVDNQNGTYTFHWRSKASLEFKVQILVNGQQVRGSPVPMTIVSGEPELSKTELQVEQLKVRHQCHRGVSPNPPPAASLAPSRKLFQRSHARPPPAPGLHRG